MDHSWWMTAEVVLWAPRAQFYTCIPEHTRRNSVLTSILQVCLMEIWKHFSTWLSPLDQALPTSFYPVSFSSKAIMIAIWRDCYFYLSELIFFFFKLPLILFHTLKKKKTHKMCLWWKEKHQVQRQNLRNLIWTWPKARVLKQGSDPPFP